MKRALFSTVAAVCLVLPLANTAKATLITINFDDLPQRTEVNNQYAGLGVVFSTGWVDPARHAGQDAAPIAYPSYASFLGLNGVGFDSYCNDAEYIQANFSGPVDFVSIDIQPFEPSANWIFGLELYDSSGNLLGQEIRSPITVQSSWDGIVAGELQRLSVQTGSANVAYAKFFGYAASEYSAVNAADFDNFTFGTAASVPDGGATMLLLGSALMALGALRRQLRK